MSPDPSEAAKTLTEADGSIVQIAGFRPTTQVLTVLFLLVAATVYLTDTIKSKGDASQKNV